MIERGESALLTAPPQRQNPKESISTERKWDDPAMDWITAQFRQIPMDGRQLLDHCLQSLEERHPGANDDALISIVGRETMEELRQMQFQPALMDEYRRYVIIKAEKDTDLNDRTEMVSWSISCKTIAYSLLFHSLNVLLVLSLSSETTTSDPKTRFSCWPTRSY